MLHLISGYLGVYILIDHLSRLTDQSDRLPYFDISNDLKRLLYCYLCVVPAGAHMLTSLEASDRLYIYKSCSLIF